MSDWPLHNAGTRRVMDIAESNVFSVFLRFFVGWRCCNLMIVEREDGYYVISEKTKKNLGGPHKTRAEAVKRLRQVEFFKHKKGIDFHAPSSDSKRFCGRLEFSLSFSDL